MKNTLAASVGALALLLAGCGEGVGDDASKDVAEAQSTALADIDWASALDGGTVVEPVVDGNTVTIDVGAAQPVVLDTSKPLKVAVLIAGGSTALGQANIAGAKDAGKELGIEVTIFDANYDSQRQQAQIQNIIDGGEFQAIVGAPNDPQGQCRNLTETAPANNILVINVAGPLCDRALAEGEDVWAPGTLAWIGNGGLVETNRQYMAAISERITEPTSIIAMSGPGTLPSTVSFDTELAAAAAANPNMQIVELISGDYTDATARTDMQNALVAHPDADAAVVLCSCMSTGVLQAVRQAGIDDFPIFADGGDAVVVKGIKDGTVDLSIGQRPYSQAAAAVQMVHAAYQGKPVPRMVWNDAARTEGGNASLRALILDATTVERYTPQY